MLATTSVLWAQFSVFPDRKDLRSPDGRLVVRSVEHSRSSTDVSGVFRSLVLVDTRTGQSRKLYDYVGGVAAAWSENRFLIVTDYASKKTARALVFRIDSPNEFLAVDKTTLGSMVPSEFKAHLERNDHVYLEVGGLKKETLFLDIWAMGRLIPKDFASFVDGSERSCGALRGTPWGRPLGRSAGVLKLANGDYFSEAFSGLASSRGVIETTTYSRSLSSRSSTRRIILSFSRRN